MKFDEFYSPYMKRGIVQRECESVGCKEATFWRYDYQTEYERIFFVVCNLSKGRGTVEGLGEVRLSGREKMRSLP